MQSQASLDQNLEGASQVFRMNEGSQLTVAHRGPKRESDGIGFNSFNDALEEVCLLGELLCGEPGALACGNEEGKVDVSSDVLISSAIEEMR